MLSRRDLLSGAAPAVAALGLASCATPLPPIITPVTGGINPAFVDAVVAYMKQICGAVSFIPTVESIVEVVAAIFGGVAAIPIVQTIAGAVQAVAAELCSAVPAAPVGRAKLRARLAGHTQYGPPVFIGKSRNKIMVYGYEGV